MIHYPITGLANYSFKSQNKCYHRKKKLSQNKCYFKNSR